MNSISQATMNKNKPVCNYVQEVMYDETNFIKMVNGADRGRHIVDLGKRMGIKDERELGTLFGDIIKPAAMGAFEAETNAVNSTISSIVSIAEETYKKMLESENPDEKSQADKLKHSAAILKNVSINTLGSNSISNRLKAISSLLVCLISSPIIKFGASDDTFIVDSSSVLHSVLAEDSQAYYEYYFEKELTNIKLKLNRMPPVPCEVSVDSVLESYFPKLNRKNMYCGILSLNVLENTYFDLLQLYKLTKKKALLASLYNELYYHTLLARRMYAQYQYACHTEEIYNQSLKSGTKFSPENTYCYYTDDHNALLSLVDGNRDKTGQVLVDTSDTEGIMGISSNMMSKQFSHFQDAIGNENSEQVMSIVSELAKNFNVASFM